VLKVRLQDKVVGLTELNKVQINISILCVVLKVMSSSLQTFVVLIKLSY
jgi:hypothetical protein